MFSLSKTSELRAAPLEKLKKEGLECVKEKQRRLREIILFFQPNKRAEAGNATTWADLLQIASKKSLQLLILNILDENYCFDESINSDTFSEMEKTANFQKFSQWEKSMKLVDQLNINRNDRLGLFKIFCDVDPKDSVFTSHLFDTAVSLTPNMQETLKTFTPNQLCVHIFLYSPNNLLFKYITYEDLRIVTDYWFDLIHKKQPTSYLKKAGEIPGIVLKKIIDMPFGAADVAFKNYVYPRFSCPSSPNPKYQPK